MLFLLADEAPDLVQLQVIAIQILHLGIQQHLASPTNSHSQTASRIVMNTRDSLDAAKAGTFGQCSDYRDLLVFWKYVCHVTNRIT